MEEESLGKSRTMADLRRLLGYSRPVRGVLYASIAGSVLGAAIQAVLPLLVKRGVDTYMVSSAGTVPERLDGVFVLAAGYTALLVMHLVLAYLTTLGLNHVGQRTVAAIRSDVWTRLHALPMAYFDRNPVGRLVTRAANDTNALADLFTAVIASGIGNILLFLGILGAMAALDLRLTGWVLLVGPPLAALTWWFRRASIRVYREIRLILARLNASLQENVQGLGVVKSFTAEPRMEAKFAELNDRSYRVEMELVQLYAVFRPIVSAMATLGIGIVLWAGGTEVLAGTMTLGTVLAFLYYVRMLFAPLQELAEQFNMLQSAVVASERIFRILDTPPEPTGAATAGPETGTVAFEGVSFAYEPDKPVLQDVSFTIRAGERVALVGPSGSGKTTVASLLLAFYRLEGQGHGRILVEGRPVEEWDARALRSRFALVQQDLFLFRGTVRRNVELFTPVSDARLQHALEGSRSTQVLERLPEGLEAPVGERGATLSQGERQLLSFARALAVDPPILILDEATASVDSVTEKEIQDALHRLLEGRTALIVAHRLSTIQECDRILVLKKGRIAEQGSHEDLMALDGLYAHLYRTQRLEQTGAPPRAAEPGSGGM